MPAKTRTPRRAARTVFDLTPDELRELQSLDSTVASLSPAPSGRDGDSYDRDIRERYRYLLRTAKANRSAWLKSRRITAAVALQAARTLYDPYRHAGFIDLVAPSMPVGYEQSVLTLEQKNEKFKAERKAYLAKLNSGPDDGKRMIFV